MHRFVRLSLIIILIIALATLSVPIFMRIVMDSYMYISLETIPKTNVAIVLGASVRNGQPSPLLADRANTAIKLYQKGKVNKILVTGDNGALSHDEVTPVRKYLLDAGIPAADIFLDHAGFDTYSSMYRARDVFQAHSATIVTQDFHLPRSLYIARRLGIDAYGIVAVGHVGSVYDYVREIPASVKAMMDLAIMRVPKYLGPSIPLEGDGTVTWY
jgi:SanA protein